MVYVALLPYYIIVAFNNDMVSRKRKGQLHSILFHRTYSQLYCT